MMIDMNKKIEAIINSLSPQAKKNLKKRAMPAWIDPMLATLTEHYFSDKNYLYEHKWDGIRIIAHKKDTAITLMTRNKKIVNADYPHIIDELKKYNFDFIIDGEVIATEHGLTDFGLLQLRKHKKNLNISYQVFDILYIEGYDVTQLPLLDRKKILHHVFTSKKTINTTEHILGKGIEYFEEACSKKWEGVIAKEIHSTYEIGARSQYWLKFKCIQEQEFVIGGFTKPQGNRLAFGALLLGYFESEKLMYAGKVGTGFSTELLQQIGSRLTKLKTAECPFNSIDIPLKDVYWVKPRLVAEIKFSEWTNYNKVRHARFLGLRNDKDAKDVVKETPLKMNKK